jgi:hypothetical protein
MLPYWERGANTWPDRSRTTARRLDGANLTRAGAAGEETRSVMTPAIRLPRALQARRRSAVAVLVFALLLALVGGAILLVFPAASSALTGPTATTEVNGLVLTLRVAPGPYFLRESLPVGVSLTNHSKATIYVEGHAGVNQGLTAFLMKQEGGGAPRYQFPETWCLWCPSGPGVIPNGLAPGQSMSGSDLLPITGSGHVTMTAGVGVFAVTTFPTGGMSIGSQSDPFAGRGPTLHLTVAAAAPPNRTVGLWRIGTHLIVIAPPQALAHLVHLYTLSVRGSYWRDSLGWQPITTLVIEGPPPICGGDFAIWSYAVGAPGYAVASETVSSC